ncbi:hypothetical protein J8273_7801 [Carpediemonas membranifera]|uniref:DUF4211 domain-containing protein n=1 Tax=Carpediemonas membranifera TaxID=201153 RepID=A0A8J6ASL0_9EUKA|nr:hypothetical protein J8273_7801 [Carpediemonas membranifera]|eukprot:KAG9390450.1 hypothetical protein J8273_7801 [Carpediemonas membranifera]
MGRRRLLSDSESDDYYPSGSGYESSHSSARLQDDPMAVFEKTVDNSTVLATPKKVNMSWEESSPEINVDRVNPGYLGEFVAGDDEIEYATSSSEEEDEVQGSSFYRIHQIDDEDALDPKLQMRLMMFARWSDAEKFAFFIGAMAKLVLDTDAFKSLMRNKEARTAITYYPNRALAVASAAKSSVWRAEIKDAVFGRTGRSMNEKKVRQLPCDICHRDRATSRSVTLSGAKYDPVAWVQAWSSQSRLSRPVVKEASPVTPRRRMLLDSDSEESSSSGSDSDHAGSETHGPDSGSPHPEVFEIDESDPPPSEPGTPLAAGWDSDEVNDDFKVLDDADDDPPLSKADLARLPFVEAENAGPVVTYRAGRMCSMRVALAHKAAHWTTRLVLGIVKRVETTTDADVATAMLLADNVWMLDQRQELEALEAQRSAMLTEYTGGDYRKSYAAMGSRNKAGKGRKKMMTLLQHEGKKAKSARAKARRNKKQKQRRINAMDSVKPIPEVKTEKKKNNKNRWQKKKNQTQTRLKREPRVT